MRRVAALSQHDSALVFTATMGGGKIASRLLPSSVHGALFAEPDPENTLGSIIPERFA
jgi:hypothetical protein